MDIIKYTHDLPYISFELLEKYFKDSSICIFDIETLGLNPAVNEVVLAGLMTVKKDGPSTLTQYFINSPEEEVILLSAIKEELNKYDVVLTYNGRHFDIPFIKKRAAAAGLTDYEIMPYNLDLYLVINGHSTFRQFLPSLKQSSIEEYMGFATGRKDEISGKESVRLYYDYLLASDEIKKNEIKSKILLHNHDDIVQLYRILPVIKQTDFHKAMNSMGFPVQSINGWPCLTVCSANPTASGLVINGTYYGSDISYTGYDTEMYPFECLFNRDKTFRFLFPVEKIKNNIFINAAQLLGQKNDCSRYGGYVNGYLILTENDKRNFLEINMITKKLLLKYLSEHNI